MIRRRFPELKDAVKHAIDRLRAARRVEESASDVLELLAKAAGSERGSYWAVDSEIMQLRAIATWSATPLDAPTSERHARLRTRSLGLGSAGHVWRTRKPLWSASLILDTGLRPALHAGLRSGVWFAVKSDTSVYGVIELLGPALEPNTPDQLFVLERLGVRLGQVLEELRDGTARLRWPPGGM